jgi:hypothetical protein
VTEATPDLYALYRYFDARDTLLYVGISGDLAVRDKSHIASSKWMQFTARSTIGRHKTLEDVRQAERAAIETEEPIFNKQYNNTPEAKARMHAYLETAGRLDLLQSDRVGVTAPDSEEGEVPARGGWQVFLNETSYGSPWRDISTPFHVDASLVESNMAFPCLDSGLLPCFRRSPFGCYGNTISHPCLLRLYSPERLREMGVIIRPGTVDSEPAEAPTAPSPEATMTPCSQISLFD